MSLRTQEALTGTGFVLPAVGLLACFGFLPLLLAAYVSLFDLPLLNPSMRHFVGLNNYLEAFKDVTLRRSLVNTVYFAVLQAPLQTALGLLLAVLVQKRSLGITVFRVGYYVPAVVSTVIVSGLWRVILDSNFGLANSFLSFLHLPRQPFLTSASQAIPTLATMLTWEWVGFSMLIFLAGLNAIPRELYEAAALDGAGSLQRFWFVTLPLLRRPATYVIVSNTVYAFKVFAPVYVITKGGPMGSTDVVIYEVYQQAFTFFRLGYASAIALIFTGLLVLFAAFQLRLLRGEVE